MDSISSLSGKIEISQAVANPDLYPCRVWYDGGIIYVEYVGQITLAKILAIYKEALRIIETEHLDFVPFIGLADKITDVKLSMSEYAKVVSAYNITTYASGAWFVGVTPSVKLILKTISASFLSNKLKFVDALEEAQREARQLISDTSILDNPSL
jgi:hypothetical protein